MSRVFDNGPGDRVSIPGRVIPKINTQFYKVKCNILTSDPDVDQGTDATGRRYQGITLTVDELNWVQMWCPQEAGGCQTII